jgi:hypothetical protein
MIRRLVWQIKLDGFPAPLLYFVPIFPAFLPVISVNSLVLFTLLTQMPVLMILDYTRTGSCAGNASKVIKIKV